ncbi:MAG: nucleotide sugar dehydrogenase [Pseudomonadota bacterium]
MKVAVVGLWHLGAVTAASLAKGGHDVIGFDPVPETIAHLKTGRAPIFEPGLENLLAEGLASGKLTYTADAHALAAAEIVWITFDTPVDHNDIADVEFVVNEVIAILPKLSANTLVIISSQLPVGTARRLQQECVALLSDKNISFACIPENLRLGKALDVFMKPDRIVVGVDDDKLKTKIQQLLLPFSENIIWMSVVAAEMTKHALNAFLAVSVTFINEIASLCETVGADAREVERGLKSEERIGPKAYLRPGGAIAGGTLMRDINYLKQVGKNAGQETLLISAIAESNSYHTEWSRRKLTTLWSNLKGKKVAMLGLTYKAGTDTLRRSTAIETCEWLHQQGTQINAYDPTISKLPQKLAGFINIKASIAEALQAVDAVVISTEWPQFRELTAEEFVFNVKHPLVLDPSGFVSKNLAVDPRIQYFSVGVPA